jgi:hypothetical protein
MSEVLYWGLLVNPRASRRSIVGVDRLNRVVESAEFAGTGMPYAVPKMKCGRK